MTRLANPERIESLSPAVATKELPWDYQEQKFINPERG
jgi:hypothetical protein